MALSISNLKSSSSLVHAAIFVLYGVGGIGKTKLASEFPSPLYLPTQGERPPLGVSMPQPTDENGEPRAVQSIAEVLDVFAELLTTEHEFKTVIIDSIDGLESLIWEATCARLGAASIEEPGFGKGYVEADTEWREYLSAVSALADAGIHVVQIGHPDIVRFDSPVTDPYSRYKLKLHKRGEALVVEKADVVGFLNYRVSLKSVEVGPKKKVTHAEGGRERQIHLVEGAGFIAKNRYGMPESITYKAGQGYTELAKYFGNTTDANDNGADTAAAA
jgi:hypothetical protein